MPDVEFLIKRICFGSFFLGQDSKILKYCRIIDGQLEGVGCVALVKIGREITPITASRTKKKRCETRHDIIAIHFFGAHSMSSSIRDSISFHNESSHCLLFFNIDFRVHIGPTLVDVWHWPNSRQWHKLVSTCWLAAWSFCSDPSPLCNLAHFWTFQLVQLVWLDKLAVP